MAQHVNIEESAAHTKHIITAQPQLPALLLSSPLTRYYIQERALQPLMQPAQRYFITQRGQLSCSAS